MSFHQWSKYDQVTGDKHKQTDHWSKLRCKSFKLCTLPTGLTFTYCNSPLEGKPVRHTGRPKDSGEPVRHNDRPKDSGEVYKKACAPNRSTLAPVGSAYFNRYLVNYLLTSPNSPQALRLYEGKEKTPSACSLRAKLGYKYWMDEPYSFNSSPGKNVTLGSRGTFLGIGVPRI